MPPPSNSARDPRSQQVRSAGKHRTLGDAPAIGPVPRMQPGSSPRRRRRRGGRHSKRAANAGLHRLLGLLLVGLSLSLGGLLLWVAGGQKSARTLAEAVKNVIGRGSSDTSWNDAPSPRDIENGVRALFDAETPGDLARLTHRGAIPPEEMPLHLASLEERWGEVSGVIHLGPLESLVNRSEGLLVDFASGTRRLAVYRRNPEGVWKVDFDAFTGHCEPPWGELVSGKADEGLVRVSLMRDYYFNHLYADDSKWACYSMSPVDRDIRQYGYARRGSRQHRALEVVMQARETADTPPASRALPHRFVLRVRRGDGAQRRQWEIVRVLADDWSIAPVPLDEMLAPAPPPGAPGQPPP